MDLAVAAAFAAKTVPDFGILTDQAELYGRWPRRFFVDALGFDLVEDSPSVTNDGRPKRWVVVRPPGAVTGILLVRADEQQAHIVGDQVAGRVGFFLRIDDVAAAHRRMLAAGVRFVSDLRRRRAVRRPPSRWWLYVAVDAGHGEEQGRDLAAAH